MAKSKTRIDAQTKEFIDLFISEGNELLDDAEIKLHNLEGQFDKDTVDTIFRMFHSIKGSAGYFNFENIQAVTHEAETLLDLIRKHEIEADHETVDILYKSCDLLRKLIHQVEDRLSDKGDDSEINDLVACISDCIIKLEKEVGIGEIDTAESEEVISKDVVERFQVESEELLEKIEEDILVLEKEPANEEVINDVFRYVHTIKGNAGFLGYGPIESKASDLEVFFETLKLKKNVLNNNVITFLLKEFDHLKRSIKEIIPSDSNNEDKYKPIGEILVDIGGTSEENVENALEKQQRPLGEILVAEGLASKKAVEKAIQIQEKMGKTSPYSPFSRSKKDIRVSTAKLDKLFELMGELVTAEVMVTSNPDLEGHNFPGLKKASNYLSKITRDLQEITMSVRMIPLEGLFTKMIRLVRDLAKKSDKQVALKMTGQDTEMDRNVIEEISDPLVHLIRNAVDHGIEGKKERKKAGKSEKAIIDLMARYEGSEIWVTVKDDGKGLQRDRIIARAKEKGLITVDSEKLSDEEVWQFILEPGFSTAEKVSDISGRGVGMDVVKRNLEKIRGKIDIFSEPGQGTEMILKIPLTMAVMDGITVRASNSLFSIPTTDILEFFKARKEQLTRTEEGQEVIRLRDDIMPLVKLYDAFSLDRTLEHVMDGIIVVVSRNEKKACLLIDEIVGSQQVVIKSLGEYFGRQKGISGCSVSGSGEVILILDTSSLLNEYLN